MNNKEYKCENKLNDKDLCNIRQTINGDYKCVNEKLSLQKCEFYKNMKGKRKYV